jgi:zinc protease
VLIARPNRSVRSIALHLTLRAGAAFDPPGRCGTAHLVARLLDQGAESLSARTIAEEFDARGISFQARARLDSLDITLRLLSRHLPFALERLALLVAQPTFPEAECAAEQARVTTEITERDQDTAACADMMLAAALFPLGHPYHAPPAGTRESVAALTREGIARFHGTRCIPQGAVLAMAGDFDAAPALKSAEQILGDWTAPSRASVPFAEAPAPSDVQVLVRPIEGKTQSDVALGFAPLVDRRGADFQAALVMNSILGDFGMGGRLGGSIRERAGLAYYAHSYLWAGLLRGPLVVRAGVAPQSVRQAVDLMRRTIEGFRRRGPKPAELRDSKQAMASAIPRRFETNAGAAALLADCEFQGLGFDFPDRVPGLIAKVSRDAVVRAARAYLTLDRCALVVAGADIEASALR